jgi:chaperonin cofactor prefoldin
MFGTTEKNLIKTVSIEQDCPTENVKVIESLKGLHGATYSLEACGKKYVYKQVGSVFMESSKANKMINDLQNQ